MTHTQQVRERNEELAVALAVGEVEPESTSKNIVIAVVGILVVIAALIPVTYFALTIGSVVFAGVTSLLNSTPFGS